MPDQPNPDALARIWKATADDLAAKLEVAEAENEHLRAEVERLREQVKQLQVYGNMERRRTWHGSL